MEGGEFRIFLQCHLEPPSSCLFKALQSQHPAYLLEHFPYHFVTLSMNFPGFICKIGRISKIKRNRFNSRNAEEASTVF